MSKKDPNLRTKYEDDDPDYAAGQSTSDEPTLRSQPKRNVKKHPEPNYFESVKESVTQFLGISKSPDQDPTSQELSDDPISHELSDDPISHESTNDHTFDDPIVQNSNDKETIDYDDIISCISFPFSYQNHSETTSEMATGGSKKFETSEEDIARIVRGILAGGGGHNEPKRVVPKLDLMRLNMHNYVDWAKKMKCALKLNKMWLDPKKDPATLSQEELQKNEDALLYMAVYLDDQNAHFITQKNETCFITVWNMIEKFHQPRSAIILTEIYSTLRGLSHKAGQSIESHLMHLEEQFTRLDEIEQPLNDAHQVGHILASVKDSSDFANIFHSAMWEDTTSLTVAKVKSVLISVQHHQKLDRNEQAHLVNRRKEPKSFQRPFNGKQHKRQPRDIVNGWRCTECKMDNHSFEECRKRQSIHKRQQEQKGLKIHPKQANQVDDDVEQVVNVARAYSGHIVHNTTPRRKSPYSTVKSRLGNTVNSHSPYRDVFPRRVRLSESSDVLSINFQCERENDFTDSQEVASGILTHTHSHASITKPFINYFQTNESSHRIKKLSTSNDCMNQSSNLNLNLKNAHQNCLPIINANCNNVMNYNKSKMKSANESLWIVDSGATLHMSKSSELLSNFTPQFGHNVIISDGSTIPIQGYGTLTIFLKDERNHLTHTLILDNVAVVPKLSVNLISVRALTSSNVSIKFTENSCYIIHPKMPILLATVSNSLYIVKITNLKKERFTYNNTAMTCIHEWHRKLGHRNIAQIKRLADTLNLKVEKCSCSSDCLGCLKGKLHALPFPQVADKPSEPRDIITTDVCGPFRTSSIGGAKYFVTFTCANTGYTEVAAISSKSQCKIELINYINRCMTQFGRFPKIIRSDRGGEYMDDEVQNFIKTNGIIFQCTVPRCPEQNGISERKNRTLLEAIRTMLMTRNLPKYLWAEALHHANNTFNNIPKEPDSSSPKEKFFNSVFDYPFIEFGASVYHTTNPHNRSKLAERGTSGIFVGIDHNSKGFRIFSNGKIRVERNVKFIKDNNIEEPIASTEMSHHDDNDIFQHPEQVQPEIESETEPRRSERIRAQQAHAAITSYEPKTYKQAVSCHEKDKWILAMESELRSIDENNTWTAVELPKGRTPIGCRWVYKIKQGELDDATRYKARLVAQGFTQKYGVDYDEVFAPVTRSSTFRTLLTVASARNLIVQQYDVKSAFLNGPLSEEIYLKSPPGSTDTNKVLKLHKCLYGLKQAARVWNHTLHKAMTAEGFSQSKYDECLYTYKDKSHICYAIVHVDDMIYSSNSLDFIQMKIEALNKSFELKSLGNVENFLGIQVSRDKKGIFAICQKNYIEKVAAEFQLEDSKGSKYPLDPGYHKLEDENLLESNNEYRKLIGMLLYISTNTRPDISAAVGILAQRVSKPRKLDFTEALRVVRYLHGTKDLKLVMFNEQAQPILTAFSDSDWAEDRTTRKSISGVIVKVLGGPVSWSSRKQDIVSTSTTEAEFYALSEAVKEIQWLKNILLDFDITPEETTTIQSDNQSTIKMIENSRFSSRTKHIDVRLHYVRDCVRQGEISLKYCCSEENIADLLTKPLAGVKTKYLRERAALI